ncbi:hypothetical protein [Desulfosporosinus orientis]|uniref:hypothetical protein n=1 Tax=Desulfosporosinus orientis TaxID=1563 RepID=UPI0013053E40|nr:hypothetical protein [Desulfosporosinus orientis]
MPQVSSALEVLTSVFGIRKANELFATLRPQTHSPCSVDRTGGTPNSPEIHALAVLQNTKRPSH